MKAANRIIKNSALLVGTRLVNKVLGLLFVTLAARYLGVADFGLISFAVAFTGMFAVLGDLGINQLIIRELARDSSLTGKYLANVLALKVFLVAAMLSAVLVAAHLLHQSGSALAAVLIVSAAVAIDAYSQTGKALFFAYERAGFISIAETIRNCTLLGGGVLAALSASGILGFACPYLAASTLVACYLFALITRNYGRLRVEFDWAFWKTILREAWPLGIMWILIQIFFRIDVVMLSVMDGNAAVGYYSAAYRLTEASLLVSNAIIMSAFPAMSVSYKASPEKFSEVYRHTFRCLMLLGLPIAAIQTILGGQIIRFIYGGPYLASVPSFQVLAWAAAVMFLGGLSSTLLVAANRQKFNLQVTISMVIANVCLNLVLIPLFSHLGAAVATLATEALGVSMGLGYLCRKGYLVPFAQLSARPLLISAAVLGGGAILRLSKANVILAGLILLALAAGLIYYWGLEVADRKLIGEMLTVRQKA